MLVWDTTHTNGVSIIIKAEDAGMRFHIVNPGIGVKGYKRNHVPLVKEPVGGIVIHGTICNKVFEGDVRIEFPDFIQGKDS